MALHPVVQWRQVDRSESWMSRPTRPRTATAPGEVRDYAERLSKHLMSLGFNAVRAAHRHRLDG
jgi:hypothetical protein